MDGGSADQNAPAVDKNTVLDVKPLRSLVPVFSSYGQTPSYVNTAPSGSYPPGFSPFYPFSAPQAARPPPVDLSHVTTHAPAPLRSFRPRDSHANGVAVMDLDGDDGENGSLGDGRRRSSAKSRSRRTSEGSLVSENARRDVIVDSDKFVAGVSLSEREDGDREIVISCLMRFDALRRRLVQLEESKEASGGRRADLKACTVLMNKGVRTNMKRRIGAVPGVEIGDIYFFRMEMCMVGMHAPSMAGIDYMVIKDGPEEETVTVSIVSSGGYEDDTEDTNVLVYSGQGGNAGAADQKLERGNLALDRSSHRFNEIRVIRGMKDAVNPNAKVYVYDGLYRIKQSWTERGKSGGNMFKHELVRIAGQPDAYAIWKSTERWKTGLDVRPGLIVSDMTSGQESVAVALVNDVDEEKSPASFTYLSTVKFFDSFKLTDPSHECSCRNACKPGDLNCACIRKNGGDFPYTGNGVLVSRKPLVYECGNTCPCIPNCKNRVSQTGIKLHFEVFKTKDRGWGLRSWDPIRAGTFICEYAGEVIDKASLARNGEDADDDDDDYAFDTSRAYHPFKWNCEPGLLEDDSEDNSKEPDLPSPLFISAKNFGNVARFMNHSCYPNTFWQPIIYKRNKDVGIHVAFFALRHIPPMTELTYDYGVSRSTVDAGDNAQTGKKACLCGSPRCRGYFG